MNKQVFKKAFVASLPVMTSYIVIAIGFGLLTVSYGFPAAMAPALSAIVYTGSLQFVLLDMMQGSAGLLSVGLTSLMMGVRHLFYGFSMLEDYKDSGRFKPYLIFSLTDETFSLVCNPPPLEPEEKKHFFFLVSLMDQISWVFGGFLGAVLGAVIPFSTEGLDFALTALFLSVVVEQWLSTKEHLPALIGLMGSGLCLLLFGADSFLFPSMLIISLGLILMYRKKEAKA